MGTARVKQEEEAETRIIAKEEEAETRIIAKEEEADTRIIAKGNTTWKEGTWALKGEKSQTRPN